MSDPISYFPVKVQQTTEHRIVDLFFSKKAESLDFFTELAFPDNLRDKKFVEIIFRTEDLMYRGLIDIGQLLNIIYIISVQDESREIYFKIFIFEGYGELKSLLVGRDFSAKKDYEGDIQLEFIFQAEDNTSYKARVHILQAAEELNKRFASEI